MDNPKTCICADDGKFYHCSFIWIRDWACLSFSDSEIELLVALDGPCCSRSYVPRGTARMVVNQRQVPVIVGDPLTGTRIFSDPAGVKRTWRAYRAIPKSTVKGFPRRFIPKDQSPTTKPQGTFLWWCGIHNQALRLLNARFGVAVSGEEC